MRLVKTNKHITKQTSWGKQCNASTHAGWHDMPLSGCSHHRAGRQNKTISLYNNTTRQNKTLKTKQKYCNRHTDMQWELLLQERNKQTNKTNKQVLQHTTTTQGPSVLCAAHDTHTHTHTTHCNTLWTHHNITGLTLQLTVHRVPVGAGNYTLKYTF